MKNFYKRPATSGRLISLLGIIAIGVVIGFGLAGCPMNEELKGINFRQHGGRLLLPATQ
jgi:hypothetical protein